MSQQELLKRVLEVLASVGLDYMVTGSVVSSLQGEPRASHDIDVVVAVPLAAVPALLAAFPPPDFLLQEEAVVHAIRDGSMFNLVALNTGDKVDFWMRTAEPFDQSRFARRVVEDFFGVPMNVSAPEDTILAKLRWCRMSGGSEKQFTDALGVFEVQRGKLERRYLDEWAARLEVTDLWERLQTQVEPP